MLEDGSAPLSHNPAKQVVVAVELVDGKNSRVSDASCGGGGDGNTQSRFSLMKPELLHPAQRCTGKPDSHHHVQVGLGAFRFRLCLLEI